MFKRIIRELFDFGFITVCKLIVAKLTGKQEYEEKYWFSKQAVCKQFSEEQIKRISGVVFEKVKGTEMHWENPKTFDEKIRWCMLYDATPLKTRLVDKYLVRDYIREK